MKRKSWFKPIVFIFLLLITGGCASTPSKSAALKKPFQFDRIIAIGDADSSYDGLLSILKETALIDDASQWIGGNTLLVQTGDFVDRGPDVRKVLDLLMSIQRQAEMVGGKVVVLLGNHEVLNIVGSRQYVNQNAYEDFAGPGSKEKQKKAFDRWEAFFGASANPEEENPEALKQKWMTAHPPGFVEYTEALGPEGRYGKWLRSLPVMFQYGGTIFLHAGISPDYAELSEEAINQKIAAEIEEVDQIRSYLMKKGYIEPYFSMSEMISVVDSILMAAEKKELPPSVIEALPRLKEFKSFLDGFYGVSPLMIDEGPMWFRGFVLWPEEQLVTYIPEWLEMKNAWRVVVSHTPRPDGRIHLRLDGSIFLVDTGMLPEVYKSGQPSALEIKNDDVYAVYATGERVSFPPPKDDYGIEHVWIGPDGNPLPFDSAEDIELFLKTASPVSSDVIITGVNRPQKVLLEKDGIRINAIFRYQTEIQDRQSIPGIYSKTRFFRDSFYSEIAAYEMNRMLGLNNMPPTVLRDLNGKAGTVQLWAEQTMSDRERAEKNILPPEAPPWNKQMWDMRVFDNLINNIDRNQTNILIDNSWRLILIDHTRSFAKDKSLPLPKNVVYCSRQLWHALRHLDSTEVRKRLEPYLSSSEIEALFIRQQLLIEMINDLIKQNGEENVLT